MFLFINLYNHITDGITIMSNTTEMNLNATETEIVAKAIKHFNTSKDAGEKRYVNNKVFAVAGAVVGAGIHYAINRDIKSAAIGAVTSGLVTGLLGHVQDQFESTGALRVAEAGIYSLCGMRMAFDVSNTSSQLLDALLGSEEDTASMPGEVQ